eukprot:TRINITY_DN6448_c0_g1_i1.p1 TRINITY_DN6448_c0_g1~~TRINITY_DN6448_c0_g1_i1.p1  ORF type:complete len:309 (+),score=80.03 TRINITY_DN6448_c0_g1_i1:60-986(+)
MKTRLLIFSFMVGLVGIGLISLMLERKPVPKPFFGTHIVAHHGSVKDFPENTIQTLERAVKFGASVVEVDVQMTKDGVLVALRDQVLEKTTEGKGYVSNSSFVDLKSLDAAFHIPQYKGKGMKIATLEQVAQWIHLPEQSGVLLLMDIQLNATLRTVHKLKKLFRQYAFLHEKAIVISYEPHILYALRTSDPQISTGLIVRNNLFSQACDLDVLPSLLCRYISNQVRSWMDLLIEEIYLWVIPYFTGSNALIIHSDALPTLHQLKSWSSSGWWINVFDVPTSKRSQKLLSLGINVSPSTLPIVTGGQH